MRWWQRQTSVFAAIIGVWFVLWSTGWYFDSVTLTLLSLVPGFASLAVAGLAMRNNRKTSDALISWAHSFAMVAMTGGSERLPRDCFSIFDTRTDQMFAEWWTADIKRHVADEATWRFVRAWPHIKADSTDFGRAQPPRDTMVS